MMKFEDAFLRSCESHAVESTPRGGSVQGRARGRPTSTMDPVALLRDASFLVRRSSRFAAGSRVEVFHRSSTRIRVSVEPPDLRPRAFEAREEGVAVRLDLDDERMAFAASSGGGRPAVEQAVALALRAAPLPRPRGGLWAEGARTSRVDLERSEALPTRDELESWLSRAIASLTGPRGGKGRALGPAWVEAGFTVETLAADNGLTALRSRRRVWAMAIVRRARGGPVPERPWVAAARSLTALPEEGWEWLLDRESQLAAGRGRGTDRGLAVTGEAAAALVASLAMAMHGPHGPRGGGVGRAWRLRDEPRWPGGLAGGLFDDAGFPTRKLVLADGSAVVGHLGTRGHFCRPSFRDHPTPMFTTLVVEDGHDPLPSRGLIADALRIHRLEPDRWVLELEGIPLDRGAPSGAATLFRLTAGPRDLVARCVRATGPARPHANGVVTPTLVFEGLRLG